MHLQTPSLWSADSMSDRDTAFITNGFLQPQCCLQTKMRFEKPTENHRERERDKEWTGLDGVVTHTDCYIHIYNRVRSDRLHLNLHLFYSFCLSLFFFSSVPFSRFLSLFLRRLVSCSIFSLPLIGCMGAFLPFHWTRSLSLSFLRSHFLSLFP